jgi:ANTAR domain/GAF domain
VLRNRPADVGKWLVMKVSLAGWARMLAEGPVEGAERSRYICQLCSQLLGVTGAGISMVTAAGNRGVVCATDEVSARIEDLQFTLGEGACVEAVTSGVPVMVADLHGPGAARAERWPAFMEGVAAAGVRAVFALPLRVGVVSVGALDLYRDVPGALTADQLSAALTAADAAAAALLQLDTGSASSFADNTVDRAAYQLQVHQASGMVMVQAGVTIEEAFLLLRAHAFAVGRPVADVARDVIERRLRFPVEDP